MVTPTHIAKIAWPLLAALCACRSPSPRSVEVKDCAYTVWLSDATYQALAKPLTVVGSFNGWKQPGLGGFSARTLDDGTDWWGMPLALPAAEYDYVISSSSGPVLDEGNPLTAFVTNPFQVDA